jgi:hypothetical protein
MAEPYPVTMLSLARFAQILGVNPVHFWGAVGPAQAFPLTDNRCNDIWPQYSYQYDDSVSRYDLALAIQDAEEAIANELGWYPAPVWINEEVHEFPRHYRRHAHRTSGLNVRGLPLSIKAKFCKTIAPGRRTADLIETATVDAGTLVYSDEDGDGFYETATVTATVTTTNVREMQVFFADSQGHPGFEIRAPREKEIAAGTFTAVFDSWLFIDPDLLGAYPTTAGFGAVDISTVDNYVSEVEVYRVYNDTSEVAAQFLWEPFPAAATYSPFGAAGAGELTEQDGTLHIRDARLGIVVPTPATYDDDEDDWTFASYSVCREPQMVKLWYYCGEHSNAYLGNRTGDPLSARWAQAIAQLTVARLERPFCSCGNLRALSLKWQQDAADLSANIRVPDRDLANPFGTRYGEILAWRVVSRESMKLRGGGAI